MLSPVLTLLVVTRAGLVDAPIVNILGLFSDKQLSFFNGTTWRLFPQGTRAYVVNFVSRNVSVVDLTNDSVVAVIRTAPLPAPGSIRTTPDPILLEISAA